MEINKSTVKNNKKKTEKSKEKQDEKRQKEHKKDNVNNLMYLFPSDLRSSSWLSFLSFSMLLLPNHTASIPKTQNPISSWFIKRHRQQLKLCSEADAMTKQNADCTETKRGSSFKQSPAISPLQVTWCRSAGIQIIGLSIQDV